MMALGACKQQVYCLPHAWLGGAESTAVLLTLPSSLCVYKEFDKYRMFVCCVCDGTLWCEQVLPTQ